MSLLESEHLAPQPTPVALPSSLPIPTFTLSRSLNGYKTDLCIQSFDDRIFVVISQMNGKVGCLTQATLPSTIPLPRPPTSSSSSSILSILPPPSPSLTLTPLLGSPPSQTVHDLYVAQVASLIWMVLESSSGGSGAGRGRRGVVVGLALRNVGRKNEQNGEEDGAEDEEEEEERKRFSGLLEMVAEWPGIEG